MSGEKPNINQPGTVPAWYFDKYKFTVDVDEDGNEVKRDSDLGCEWRWRNCILTNPHLVMCRRQWKLDIIVAQNKKMRDNLAVKNEVLKNLRESLAAHETKLGKPLAEWTFAEFFRLKVVDMKNFMKSRTPGVVLPCKSGLRN